MQLFIQGATCLMPIHTDADEWCDADICISGARIDGLLPAQENRAGGERTLFDAGGLLSLVAFMMNWRSRATGIATGDQALFVTRAAFERAGGFPAIALMEDVALSARLKRLDRPLALRARVTTSARSWRKHGTLRTVLLMWRLRLAFFFGTDPAKLARQYGHAER